MIGRNFAFRFRKAQLANLKRWQSTTWRWSYKHPSKKSSLYCLPWQLARGQIEPVPHADRSQGVPQDDGVIYFDKKHVLIPAKTKARADTREASFRGDTDGAED
jgi:hypothetical protein